MSTDEQLLREALQLLRQFTNIAPSPHTVAHLTEMYGKRAVALMQDADALTHRIEQRLYD